MLLSSMDLKVHSRDRHSWRFLFFVGVWLLLSGVPVSAQLAGYLAGSVSAADPSVARSDYVEARLIHANTAVAPGEPFWVGVTLKHADKWHTYFKNPGASGEQTQIDWTLPEGFEAGPIQWPAPERYDFSGFVNYVYHGETLLAVRITPPADLEPGTTVKLEAMVHWLECAEVCIPAYDKALAVELPVVAGTPPAHPTWAPAIETALAALPKALPVGYSASFFQDVQAETLTLLIERTDAAAPRFEDLYFFASDVDGTTGPAPVEPTFEQAFTVHGDHQAYTLVFPINAAYPEVPAQLRGYLQAISGEGIGFALVSAPEVGAVEAEALLAGMPTPQAPGVLNAEPGLMWLLGAFFLGGLILNLMPCVFPVLGVKIVGFVKQAGENRAKVLAHGLVFSGGVLACFWALGLVIALLQEGTLTFINLEETGWGGWLQLPGVVLVLAMIVFLFALNMSGVFEIGQNLAGKSSRLLGKDGYGGTFLSGLLAVAVGTPCAAPILAPALTAVFDKSWPVVFVLLTTMGVGLALPYLLLSAFPGWVKRLPRPGPWMEHFKKIMAFPLYATAGALLWVLSLQADSIVLWTVVGFAVMGLGAYLYGIAGQSRKVRVRQLGGAAAALVVLVTVGTLLVALDSEQKAGAIEAELVAAEQRVESLRSEREDVLQTIAEDVLTKGDLMYVELDRLQERLRQIDAQLVEAEQAQEQLRASTDRILWEPWSAERQAELLAEGRTVYVDFTARWCVTCLTNKAAYEDREVIERFKEAEVVALKADWTNRNAAIAAELARFDRKAIPFNVVYGHGSSEPVILPELLTPSAVLEAMEAAVGSPTSKPGTVAARQ